MDKQKTDINRRKFLKGSASVLAGASIYSITPNFAFAETDELADLADLFYQVFPHSSIPQKYYQATAQGLLDKAAGDEKLNKVVQDGLKMVNTIFSSPFRNMNPNKKTMVMDRIRATDFYTTLRGHAVVAFYNNKGTWPYFGYPGSSFEQGGYIDRGVGDIFWVE